VRGKLRAGLPAPPGLSAVPSDSTLP